MVYIQKQATSLTNKNESILDLRKRLQTPSPSFTPRPQTFAGLPPKETPIQTAMRLRNSTVIPALKEISKTEAAKSSDALSREVQQKPLAVAGGMLKNTAKGVAQFVGDLAIRSAYSLLPPPLPTKENMFKQVKSPSFEKGQEAVTTFNKNIDKYVPSKSEADKFFKGYQDAVLFFPGSLASNGSKILLKKVATAGLADGITSLVAGKTLDEAAINAAMGSLGEWGAAKLLPHTNAGNTVSDVISSIEASDMSKPQKDGIRKILINASEWLNKNYVNNPNMKKKGFVDFGAIGETVRDVFIKPKEAPKVVKDIKTIADIKTGILDGRVKVYGQNEGAKLASDFDERFDKIMGDLEKEGNGVNIKIGRSEFTGQPNTGGTLITVQGKVNIDAEGNPIKSKDNERKFIIPDEVQTAKIVRKAGVPTTRADVLTKIVQNAQTPEERVFRVERIEGTPITKRLGYQGKDEVKIEESGLYLVQDRPDGQTKLRVSRIFPDSDQSKFVPGTTITFSPDIKSSQVEFVATPTESMGISTPKTVSPEPRKFTPPKVEEDSVMAGDVITATDDYGTEYRIKDVFTNAAGTKSVTLESIKSGRTSVTPLKDLKYSSLERTEPKAAIEQPVKQEPVVDTSIEEPIVEVPKEQSVLEIRQKLQGKKLVETPVEQTPVETPVEQPPVIERPIAKDVVEAPVTKNRKVPTRAIESTEKPFMSPEIKQAAKDVQEYTPQSLVETSKKSALKTTEQLKESLKQAETIGESPENISDAIELYSRAESAGNIEEASTILQSLSKIGTKYGQLINQFKEFKTKTVTGIILDIEQQSAKAGIEIKPKTKKLISESAQAHLDANKDVEDAFAEALLKPLDTATRKKLYTAERNAHIARMNLAKFLPEQLSQPISTIIPRLARTGLMGISTGITNAVSNTGLLLARAAELPFNMVADLGLSLATKKRAYKIATPNKFDIFDMFYKTGEMTLEGGVSSTQLSKAGHGVSRPINAVQRLFGRLSGDAKYPSKITNFGKAKDIASDVLESTLGVPDRAMTTILGMGDVPAMAIGKKNELRSLGMYLGKDGEDLERFILQAERDHKISDAIVNEVEKKVLFQENTASRLADNIFKALGGKSVTGKKIAEYTRALFVPFVRWNSNMIEAAASRSIPLYSGAKFISSVNKLKTALREGDKVGAYIAQKNASEAVTHMAEGTTLMFVGGALIANGIITTTPNAESNIAGTAKKTSLNNLPGQQSGFNLTAFDRYRNGENPKQQEGDKIVGIEKVMPHLAAMMDLTKKSNDLSKDEKFKAMFGNSGEVAKAGAMIWAPLQTYFAESAIGALGSLTDTGAYQAESTLIDLAKRAVSTFMPKLAFDDVNTILSGKKEEPKDLSGDTFMDTMKNNVNYKMWTTDREKLPAKYGAFGEKVSKDSYWGIATSDPVYREVQNVVNETGTTDAFPAKPRDYFTVDKQEVKLDKEQYKEFQQITGVLRKIEYTATINDPNYKSLSYKERSQKMVEAAESALETAKKYMKSKYVDNISTKVLEGKIKDAVEIVEGRKEVEEENKTFGTPTEKTNEQRIIEFIKKAKEQGMNKEDAFQYLRDKGLVD